MKHICICTLVVLSCLALAAPAWASHPYESTRVDKCGRAATGFWNGSRSSFVEIGRGGGMLAKLKNGYRSSFVEIGKGDKDRSCDVPEKPHHGKPDKPRHDKPSRPSHDKPGKPHHGKPDCDVPEKPHHGKPDKPRHDKPSRPSHDKPGKPHHDKPGKPVCDMPHHEKPSKPHHGKPDCDVPEKPHHGKPDKPQHDKPGKPHHEKPGCDNKPHKPHGECDKPEPEPEPQPEPVDETVYSVENELVPYVYVKAEYEFSDKVSAGVKVAKPFKMNIAQENGRVIEEKKVDVIVGPQVSVKVADQVAVTATADFYFGETNMTDCSVGVSAEIMKGVNLQVAQHFGDFEGATTVGIAIAF